MRRCKFAPEYELINTTVENEELGTYVTYGISCKRKDAISGRCYMRAIEDVSTDKETVSGMVELFNMCCLSPDYLKNVVVSLIS